MSKNCWSMMFVFEDFSIVIKLPATLSPSVTTLEYS